MAATFERSANSRLCRGQASRLVGEWTEGPGDLWVSLPALVL